MKKKDLLWYTAVGLAGLFALLCFTGLLNWLVFTGGHGTGNPDGPSAIRHFLCDIHGWAGFIFIILVGVHLFLHLDYIKKKMNRPKK